MLCAVKALGYDVIAMAKKSSRVHYLYNGTKQPLTEIYKNSKKRRGRSRYLLSVEVTINKDEAELPARIVFVRNRHKRKDYLALITTDMSLSEDEIMQLYGKRWDIEVFFKVCKSYLKLSKECNSLSYDAMTAHTAVVFSRYMMLSVENRRQIDDRTLGELFYFISDELADITWIEAFHLFMQAFIHTLTDKFSLTSDQLDQLIDDFTSTLPIHLKRTLKISA